MSLGSRIKSLRNSKGLTQVKLASLAQITQSSLSELERGDTKKGFGETIVRLAIALGTSPEWLATGKGNPTERIEANVDESEAIAIYRALPLSLRSAWIASGRAMLATLPATKTSPYQTTRSK